MKKKKYVIPDILIQSISNGNAIMAASQFEIAKQIEFSDIHNTEADPNAQAYSKGNAWSEDE